MMEKYEITKDDVLRLEEILKEWGVPRAKCDLREWFPSAFEEWEEVPLSELHLTSCHGETYLADKDGRHYARLSSGYSNDAGQTIRKIESGRIWRRKSAG